jgi:hypothetical protein
MQSSALGVGGMLKYKERFKGKKVVAVVCGRNIDLEVFKKDHFLGHLAEPLDNENDGMHTGIPICMAGGCMHFGFKINISGYVNTTDDLKDHGGCTT